MNKPQKLRRESDRLIEREMMILSVGEAIGGAMQSLGIDQAELARRLKKTSGDVSQLLSGDRNLTLGTISKIAYALGYRARVVMEPLPKGQQALKPLEAEVKAGGIKWRIPEPPRSRKAG